MVNWGRLSTGTWLATLIGQRTTLFALVLVVFLVGTIAGGMSVGSLNALGKEELSQYLQQLLSGLAVEGVSPSNGWYQVILNDVFRTAGLMWLLGLSVIGVPLIAAVVFFRGFVLGFTMRFLIEDLLLRGAALAIIALVPQNLFLVPGLICAAVGAIAFSLALLRIVLGRSLGANVYHHLRTEGSITLIGCIFLLAGGLLESCVSPALTAAATRYLFRGF